MDGYTGWIHLDYAKALSSLDDGTVIGWYRISYDYDPGIAVRKGLSGNEELLRRIPNGTQFYVSAVNGIWGYTTVNDYTGWIKMDNLKL